MLTFYDVKRREEIIAFLDTRIKSIDEDPIENGLQLEMII